MMRPSISVEDLPGELPSLLNRYAKKSTGFSQSMVSLGELSISTGLLFVFFSRMKHELKQGIGRKMRI
jgi:hypothetical protein